MPSNKLRLYIALYPSGVVNNEERKYHWGFLVGPKLETNPPVAGTRYHVRNRAMTGWEYEAVPLRNVANTTTLLARILVAKIIDKARLVGIFETTPVVQNDPNWRCRTWIAEVLRRIADDGKTVGTGVLDWTRIESAARQYVANKTASGRYAHASRLLGPKPTWDMITGTELVA